MTPVIFDGRMAAKEKEDELQKRVEKLRKRGVTPRLVSIVVGDENGALKYQEMKKKAGERVGVEVEIRKLPKETKVDALRNELGLLRKDQTVHGIMIQLPLPKNFSRADREELINAIDPKKDVDGMREDSPFISPVVAATLSALKKATLTLNYKHVAVIGSQGFEGKKIMKTLYHLGLHVTGYDKEDVEKMQKELHHKDVVISCTGSEGFVTGDMLSEGTIAIDIGAPKGDFDFESTSKKVSFITPVPGGIGPVTIALLMENVVEAAENGR